MGKRPKVKVTSPESLEGSPLSIPCESTMQTQPSGNLEESPLSTPDKGTIQAQPTENIEGTSAHEHAEDI
jgi:hypothetical protein